MTPDLIIRGGMIVDGTGSAPFVGDIAIAHGKILAVGTVPQSGQREIDACGFLVTPGFVDIHTHYDGQAIWADRMAPSSSHGVTTVVIGNCGVGFAPCRASDRDLLIDVMEGVEDIPGAVMAEGLPWTWETFPEYLDALDARPRDIDIAAYFPHSPLRVYVMGQRGANREVATAEDCARMQVLAREAIEAGAIGFSSSRLALHKTGSGVAIPSYAVAENEIDAIVAGVAEAGGGLIQFVPDLPMTGYEAVLAPLFRIAAQHGQPLTFTLATGNEGPRLWPVALGLMEDCNAAGGRISAQIFPRPIGMMLGLTLSAHPFVSCPTYKALSTLPLAERVVKLRDPTIRASILSEEPEAGHPLATMARNWRWIFPMDQTADYEPAARHSLAARAAERGVGADEEAYDRLLDDNGEAMLLLALGNYQDNELDIIGTLMKRDDIVLGLGDGGAHYGMICDASFPTFLLTHWARDRPEGRMSIEEAVQHLSMRPTAVVGLGDRGRIAPGYRADINIIDHARLTLHRPTVVHDLPGGGRRLDQRATGFIATIVKGEIIAENDEPTGALPGRLVRGQRSVANAAEIAVLASTTLAC